MALADFAGPAEWAADLDTRWPERTTMRELVMETLASLLAETPAPRIAELGSGDGELLQVLWGARPDARLTAVDVNPTLLQYVQGRVKVDQLVEQDLTDMPWGMLAGFSALYSLQSFHDLGGRDVLERVYAHAFELLAPGGVLINADFVVPMAHDNPQQPRRFAATEHELMLRAAGFDQVTTVGTHGLLGCMMGMRPG